MLNTMKVPLRRALQIKYDFMMMMQNMTLENGVGKRGIDIIVLDGHIMMRIITILLLDENFIVHGYSRQKPSSQQSRCWHMSGVLERDCDELLDRIRKPIIYGKVDSPDGYHKTDVRRCESCPSEYYSGVKRIEGEDGDDGKKYPYGLFLQRWVDLGELKNEEETQEFKALTAGQVCCDHSTRAEKLPVDCLWQGRDWSTIPSMRDRMERYMKELFEKDRKKWYHVWK